MKPYAEYGGITIYHGDCRDIMPLFEGKSVGLVVTDPPYGIGYSTGYRKVARSSTRITNDLMTGPLLNDTAAAIGPLLNDTAASYIFSSPKRLAEVIPPIRRHLGGIVNVLVWDKGNCTAGDLATTWGQQWEAILFCRKKRTPLLGGRDRDIIRISRGNARAYLHPTQKPIALCETLIAKHDADVVLDPFMGSGTTLLAARGLGRKAIGIEIEEKWCEIAAKRLEEVRL